MTFMCHGTWQYKNDIYVSWHMAIQNDIYVSWHMAIQCDARQFYTLRKHLVWLSTNPLYNQPWNHFYAGYLGIEKYSHVGWYRAHHLSQNNTSYLSTYLSCPAVQVPYLHAQTITQPQLYWFYGGMDTFTRRNYICRNTWVPMDLDNLEFTEFNTQSYLYKCS